MRTNECRKVIELWYEGYSTVNYKHKLIINKQNTYGTILNEDKLELEYELVLDKLVLE